MMRSVRIEEVGDTEFLADEQVDRFRFIEENDRILNAGGDLQAPGNPRIWSSIASRPSSTRFTCTQWSQPSGSFGQGFSGQWGSLATSRSASTMPLMRPPRADFAGSRKRRTSCISEGLSVAITGSFTIHLRPGSTGF
jgi:hypothetical protein